MDSYKELLAQAEALSEGNVWILSVYANISSLLFNNMENVSWVGFYIAESRIYRTTWDPSIDKLLLGPFCGNPACTVIPFGRGVCGTAAVRKETVIVEDVGKFPGHIACDAESRSEIVVPFFKDGRVVGVLDIDSKQKGRFGERDREGLEAICRVIEKKL
ncbi:MAG: GAF domain-containing protein [Clostridia bacterium]|nr:GAF domain-containing protein [Clostridia bacterium]